jgi:dTDP-4-amino-4,6-dideoxygalactose transaminase
VVHVVDGPWPPWPAFDDEQVEAAARVLRSGRVNYWTGDEGRSFEREFAEYTGVRHAVFVANGTVGLEAALEALDLPPASDVITTPRTFIATSSAIVRTGHRPVFADVDRDSGAITAETIAAAFTPRTTAVVLVHLGGWPADLPAIRDLCDRHGLRLVEDCSQAHGAMVDGRHVGTVGDIAVWSFCQDKIITTGGEGGMVATDDEDLWRRVWSLKDHGKSWEAVYEREHPPGFRWLHESIGTNWRGTEVQAALGRIQYRRLDEWRAARTANAVALADRLDGVPGLRVPRPDARLTHAYYRLYAYLEPGALAPGWTRDRLLGDLRLPAPVLSGSCSEIYREVALRAYAPADPLPVAAELGETALAFLVHPGLGEAEMAATATAVTAVLDQARAAA